MEDVFSRMINLWSLEIRQSSIATDHEIVKTMLSQMNGEDIKAGLAALLRERFLAANPDASPYNIDDLPDFLQWLSDRYKLPMVVSK